MIRVDVNVNDAEALLATGAYSSGALLRIERATSEAGSYSEVTTTALVSGTNAYTYWDASGATTSWYRTRISNSGGTNFSAYSDPFRATAILAYATPEDLEEMLPSTNVDRDRNYLWDKLIDATGYINQECQRDFFRHPQVSGTEARTLRTDGSSRLIVDAGIVSITTVEVASSFGGSWTTLGAENTDWYLDDPVTSRAADGTGLTSYFSIRLPSNGSLTRWYDGPRLARLTGVFGWSEVPGPIRAGALALAREYVAQKLTAGGSPRGDEGFSPLTPLPNETYRAIVWGKRMHYGSI